MSKICNGCGYISKHGDPETKCPLCGQRLMIQSETGSCDREFEQEWNEGYHDDFKEGRKTGEYCDRELEKNINGGEHYHGSQKTTYTDGSFLPFTEDTPISRVIIISLVITVLFPFVGAAIIFFFTKDNKDEPFAKKARAVSVAVIILMIILFNLRPIISEIINYGFY